MTDLLQIICDYLLENRYKEFLPSEYFWHLTRLADKQKSTLLDQYVSTRNLMHSHELEAMFQAAWKASRELG